MTQTIVAARRRAQKRSALLLLHALDGMQRTDHTLRGVSSGTLDKLEKRESSPERLPPPVATCPPSPWRQAWSRHLERSPTTLKAATPRPALSKVNFLTSQALLLGRRAARDAASELDAQLACLSLRGCGDRR